MFLQSRHNSRMAATVESQTNIQKQLNFSPQKVTTFQPRQNDNKTTNRGECIAKNLQKQFPNIKLEQSIVKNGCSSNCPVHGSLHYTKANSESNYKSQTAANSKSSTFFKHSQSIESQSNRDLKNSKPNHNSMTTPKSFNQYS